MSKARINKALLLRDCEKARSEYVKADIVRLQADDNWSQACMAFDKAREQISKSDKQCKEASAAFREAKRIYEEMRMDCLKHNINPFHITNIKSTLTQHQTK